MADHRNVSLTFQLYTDFNHSTLLRSRPFLWSFSAGTNGWTTGPMGQRGLIGMCPTQQRRHTAAERPGTLQQYRFVEETRICALHILREAQCKYSFLNYNQANEKENCLRKLRKGPHSVNVSFRLCKILSRLFIYGMWRQNTLRFIKTYDERFEV